MTLSIRARLTVWYSLVVVIVLVAGAVAVSVVQERLVFDRLDRELERLMLTLEGVMRTEFGEGLDLQAAADEASIEVVAPDRSLVLMRPDGRLLAVWGRPLESPWKPPPELANLETVIIGSTRLRAFSRPVTHTAITTWRPSWRRSVAWSPSTANSCWRLVSVCWLRSVSRCWRMGDRASVSSTLDGPG